MFDFIDWFIENRNKPLGYIVLAAVVFLIDRFGRNLITSQVKRLFHVDDKSEFRQYLQNQQRIEEKVNLLLQKEGIIWHATTLTSEQEASATRQEALSVLQSAINTIARVVGKFTDWRKKKMSNINKAILLPLLSAIALFAKQAYGYEVPDEWINMAADIILYLIMFAGLFIKPKKEKEQPKEDNEAYYH